MVEVTMRPPNPRGFTKERLRVIHCRRELLKAQAAAGLEVTDSPVSPVYEPERVPKRRAGSPPPGSRRLRKASPGVNRAVVLTASAVKKKKRSVTGKHQPDFSEHSDSSDSRDCSCTSDKVVE